MKRTVSSLLEEVNKNSTNSYYNRATIGGREYSASLLKGHLQRLLNDKHYNVFQKFEGSTLVIFSNNPDTKTTFQELDKKAPKEVKEKLT